jgi:hypothetical protein
MGMYLKLEVHGKKKVPEQLQRAFTETWRMASSTYQGTSLNGQAEVYLANVPNDFLPMFPRSEDGFYSLPPDLLLQHMPAFAYFGEGPKDIPKMAAVWQNIDKHQHLRDNLHALLGHELGHLNTWNFGTEQRARENLGKVIPEDISNKEELVIDLAEMVSNAAADEGVIRQGYEMELLGLRKGDQRGLLESKKFYFWDISAAMTLFACYGLLERKSRRSSIRTAASDAAHELHVGFIKKLKAGENTYHAVRAFTGSVIDAKAYSDLGKLLELEF